MLQYLDFRSENDIQTECSPVQPETEIPKLSAECIYCRKCKVCTMPIAKCSYITQMHTCKLP